MLRIKTKFEKITLICVFLTFAPRISASTDLIISPANIINSSLTPGNNFAIDINIVNVTDLSGYEFNLSFNRSIINVVQITEGSILSPRWCPKREIDNLGGNIWIACTSFNNTSFNGSGKLDTVKLSVIGIGESTLHLYNTKLGDSQGWEIEHNTTDGFFNNTPTECIMSNPNLTVSPTLRANIPGSTLNYTINVANNDNFLCNASVFNLSLNNLPDGWNYSFDSDHLLIKPLFSNSTILRLTSDKASPLGEYEINITAINNKKSGYNNTASIIYRLVEKLIKISEVLLDSFGNPVRANISMINTYSFRNNTDLQGRYYFTISPGIYDIFFNVSNFLIPNFWLKMLSVEVRSENYNKLIRLTNYTNEISLIFNITGNQTIQSYSANEPLSVKRNNTALTRYYYLENLTDNFGWYYNISEKVLYIKFNETVI